MDKIMRTKIDDSVYNAKVALAAANDIDTVIGDAPPMFSRLIADLAHLAERNGHDLAWIMENAARTYEAERNQSTEAGGAGTSQAKP